MKKYITTILCLMTTVLVACNDNNEAYPYILDYDVVPTYTLSDGWKAYDAFNTYLLDANKHIYKKLSSDETAENRWNGAAAIWCQPMFADMALNAYNLAQNLGDNQRSTTYKQLAKDVMEGNIKQFCNFNFDDNDVTYGWFIYDDIQWWTITLARAYQTLGEEKYRTLAERSFARVWYGSPRVGDTGSYADPNKELGGGMFWQWQPLNNPLANKATDGKMACINFPTVVAALTLYNCVPNDRVADTTPESWSNQYGNFIRPHYETKAEYLNKGKEIYDWAFENLVNQETGAVADNRHGENTAWDANLEYNQATFIGASVLLYKATGDEQYLANARLGADFALKSSRLNPNGYDLLPYEVDDDSDGELEQGIYTTILAQYMAMLIYDCGQKDYLPYMQRNICYGWNNRDKSRDLCGGDYSKVLTEGSIIDSYTASGIPALMLLFPMGE